MVLITVSAPVTITGSFSGPTFFPSEGASVTFGALSIEESASGGISGIALVLTMEPGLFANLPYQMGGQRNGSDVTIAFNSLGFGQPSPAWTFTGMVEDGGNTLRGTIDGQGSSSGRLRLDNQPAVFTRD